MTEAQKSTDVDMVWESISGYFEGLAGRLRLEIDVLATGYLAITGYTSVRRQRRGTPTAVGVHCHDGKLSYDCYTWGPSLNSRGRCSLEDRAGSLRCMWAIRQYAMKLEPESEQS